MVDDLNVVVGVYDIPAYYGPLIESLWPVITASFLSSHLADIGLRGHDKPILGHSFLEVHGKRN